MATIYHEGLGVDRDPEMAVRWWLKAAEAGHPGAAGMLGVSYHMGLGVRTDLVEAMAWVLVSAGRDSPIGRAYLPRISPELTSDQVDAAKRLAATRGWEG